MTNTEQLHPNEVLGKALQNAATALGITLQDLPGFLDNNYQLKSHITLNPEREQGKIAIMVINIYQNLYSLVDGNYDLMLRWMNSPNSDTGGTPAEQIKSKDGSFKIMNYVESMYNRT